jgi:CheY-like chemotaxis protein
MKILLVDDDAFLRDMYATKFTELNHEIEVAETSEQAIAKLQDAHFDVVLMDMVMPSMTGVELLKRIKSEKLGGNPACIMLSNQSEEHDKSSAKSEGALGYIVKAEHIPSEVVKQVVEMMEKAK